LPNHNALEQFNIMFSETVCTVHCVPEKIQTVLAVNLSKH